MIPVIEAIQLRRLLNNENFSNDSIEVLQRFGSTDDIKKVLFNREPYLLIDSAVVFRQKINDNQKKRIVAQTIVTEQHCVGHYPGYPMLPFALMGEIVGQAGALLLVVACHEEIGDATPLAVKVANLKSGNSGPVFPGDVLTIVAEMTRIRGGFAVITAIVIVRDEVVVTLDEGCYWAVNLPLKRLDNGDIVPNLQ